MQILYCDGASCDRIASVTRHAVRTALQESGRAYRSVPDLCAAAARRDPFLAECAGAADLTVIACHPRTVRWLLHAAATPLNATTVAFLDMCVADPAPLLAGLAQIPYTAGAAATTAETQADAWVPWFPVIDYQRCQNCGQCLNFCLFGVYARDDSDRVTVRQPRNCKTNCPACARICPEVAIIFPKSREAPIDGSPLEDEDAARSAARTNAEVLEGSDVYAALAARRRKTPAPAPPPPPPPLLTPDARARALAERDECAAANADADPCPCTETDEAPPPSEPGNNRGCQSGCGSSRCERDS